MVKSVTASIGVKIAAYDLENAIAGSKLYVVKDNEEEVFKKLEDEIQLIELKKDSYGVTIAANTLGSMEALVSFFKNENIPIGNILLGKIKKKDILKASLASNKIHRVILSFNVQLDKDLVDVAKDLNVKVYTAEIIYHLLDYYKSFSDSIIKADKENYKDEAVFPCKLKILPNCLFCTRTPLIIGVEVMKGLLKLNTPVCVIKDGNIIKLGVITNIEESRKSVNVAKKGAKVAVKISNEETNIIYNRHFSINDSIYSVVTRKSIDTLKQYFKDELDEDQIQLLFYLKRVFDII